jgi:hypothetical protein
MLEEELSCVRGDGTLTIRWTLSADMKPATKWRYLGSCLSNYMLAPLSLSRKVAMAGSCTLRIDSFSKLKATLWSVECAAYSKPLYVGGSRWYLKLYPNCRCRKEDCVSLWLVREPDDQPAMTAEFKFQFQFQGVASYESDRVTYTFDRANNTNHYEFEYQMTQPAKNDALIIRCRLNVIPVPTATIFNSDSVRTPLLSDMQA